MIASLTGQVTAIAADSAVIDVGGVGMTVRATPQTLADLRVGTRTTVHTTLIVREDSLTLYGFSQPEERDLFALLQTAGGVGPRLAQAALAVHAPAVVRRAIATGDTTTLTRIPGVGKKGAERLVLELKDKIGPVDELPTAAGEPAHRPVAWRDQVQQGLMALGWSAKDSQLAVKKLDGQVDGEPADVPTLLKQAIRLLGKTR